MQLKRLSRSAILRQNADLHTRLEEAAETLHAIRSGDVDALVIQSPAGPQVYTIQGHDAEANRFRGEMLAQVSDAVIAIDGLERVIYLNAAAERLYGLAASMALGRTISEIYEARWLHPEDAALARTALRERGEWHGESIHVRRDGLTLNVESGMTVLRETGGQTSGVLAIIRDVTERKQHEAKVLVSEIRYRRLFEAANDGVLILDPDTLKIVDANPFMTQMLGYSHSQLVGKELFEIGLLDDEAASREVVWKLSQATEVRYENLPLKSQSGLQYEVEVVANRYDENGHDVIQFNIRDISERKRSEQQVRLLMAEVNHRAKNLLAVVQAVAHQTAKYGEPATFALRLSARIDALAAGHDLLVKNEWQGVEVAELVEIQFAHFMDLIGTRVLIEGPRAQLTLAAAQGIGMALHELTTNAAKYGALSNQEGNVRIAWNVTAAASPTFSMSWRESGGPKVAAPTRKGFGQIVIGRMVEAAVDGTVMLDYREQGLSWELSAPAESALMSPRSGP
jgi:PAS domain S-box-containing protein